MAVKSVGFVALSLLLFLVQTQALFVPDAPRLMNIVKPFNSLLVDTNMNNTIAHLSSYYNRFFKSETGLQAAVWIHDQFHSLIQKYERSDITIQYFNHSWIQPSIIIHIEGSDAQHKDELVIIGAHEDSINRENYTVDVSTGRAPGANDDASGVAALLEMFRVFLDQGFRPQRSVEFHLYSAEEEGLYGSKAVAEAYARSSKVVAGMLQLDQLSYLRDKNNETIAVFEDNTDPQLTRLLTQLIETYTTLPWVRSNENHRADSDFHSWTNNGYPACYMAEGPVDDIVFGNSKHTDRDVMSTISLPHAMQITRAAVGFLVEMSILH
eukprot:Colp12_sorted_trinity150504_noHs@2888